MKEDIPFIQEQNHLTECLHHIDENIKMVKEKITGYKQETEALFRAVHQGDSELYDQLFASQQILDYTKRELKKNQEARKKAYFGRIDYQECKSGIRESWYIGKNGVNRNHTEIIIVDWRAPVSSVYYENEIGIGSYQVFDKEEKIEIDLTKKRTYDVQEEKLLGYYDNDVVSSDELLIKYLAQNKDVILGDIIATIQKEQNMIIRDQPAKHIIVQGVAGSGKTTVAMHRISYLLYNYENRYKPGEFCIIGSNDLLLSYITSGLPELDVYNIKQMCMDKFFIYLMGKNWKKSYQMVELCRESSIKSKIIFAQELEKYLSEWREKIIPQKDIQDDLLGIIFYAEGIKEKERECAKASVAEFISIINDRIRRRIRFLCHDESERLCKNKIEEYGRYFSMPKNIGDSLQVYCGFIESYASRGYLMEETLTRLKKKQLDIYDLASVVLVWKRLFAKNQPDEFSQIIIDEAQDFGEMVYYCLKEILPNCYFTIMGDVSQNIHYETGMNNWKELRKALFQEERDSFYLLTKSYRNTIEISEFAGKVLEKASEGEYKIQPVIRHGRQVEQIIEQEENMIKRAEQLIREIFGRGYDTIAVICRTEEEAGEVEEALRKCKKDFFQGEGKEFRKGLMVLPIEWTKGLEFDTVILWKPDKMHYGCQAKEAKLLYVAITRALHELYLLGTEMFTLLLD